MNTTHAAYACQYEALVLQNVSEIIVITDLQFVVQFWNNIAEKFYGVPASDAIGKPMTGLVQFAFHDTTLQASLDDLQQHKVWRGKVSVTNADGHTFFFLQTVKYILDKEGQEVGIMALGHDITDKQKAEDKLVRSKQFYHALIADSLDLTLLLNAEGKIIFTTPSVKRILGYSEDEILNSNAFQYIHPEDLSWAMLSFEKEVEEKPEIKFIIIRVLKKSGEWLWCMIRGNNLLDNPAINAIAIYLHDDTPRKKATEALRESEKRFRSLTRDLPIGILVQNAQGNIEITNDAMCRLFDVREEELLGSKIWELFTDVTHEDGRCFLQEERPAFKALQTKQLVKDVVMGVWHTGRQERVWIMINADPVLDEEGNVLNVVCSVMDITGRKKLENKSFAKKMTQQRLLAQATIDGQEKERLEMGKELHDNIGQQLTTVKLFLELAEASADDKTRNMVQMALGNISAVINEVRSISHSLVPPTLRDLGLIDSVNDLIDSLRTAQSLCISFNYFEFDEDRLPENKKLAIYRIIQEQMNNIIKHARAKHVSILLRQTASNVSLQIKDNGVGFDSQKIKKGLGITNIHNRTELFGGKVLFITSPGNGCEVNINLPQSADMATFG